MNSLSLSTTDEEMFMKIIKQPSKTIKYDFVKIGRKLAEIPNQRRDTVARDITLIMKGRATIK